MRRSAVRFRPAPPHDRIKPCKPVAKACADGVFAVYSVVSSQIPYRSIPPQKTVYQTGQGATAGGDTVMRLSATQVWPQRRGLGQRHPGVEAGPRGPSGRATHDRQTAVGVHNNVAFFGYFAGNTFGQHVITLSGDPEIAIAFVGFFKSASRSARRPWLHSVLKTAGKGPGRSRAPGPICGSRSALV